MPMSAPVDVVTGANGTTFKIIDTQYGTFDAAIPTAGIHTVYDALAAYAAATAWVWTLPLRCRAGDLSDDGHAPAYRGKGRHHLH